MFKFINISLFYIYIYIYIYIRHISHEYDGIEYLQKFQKALCALFDWEARAYILLSEQSTYFGKQ